MNRFSTSNKKFGLSFSTKQYNLFLNKFLLVIPFQSEINKRVNERYKTSRNLITSQLMDQIAFIFNLPTESKHTIKEIKKIQFIKKQQVIHPRLSCLFPSKIRSYLNDSRCISSEMKTKIIIKWKIINAIVWPDGANKGGFPSI